MSSTTWRRLAWSYHIAFALAVTWPVQSLVNDPRPFVLGLPLQMAWCAAWILGSLVVFWRLDTARARDSATTGNATR